MHSGQERVFGSGRSGVTRFEGACGESVNVMPTELDVISSREDYIQHLMQLLRVNFNPKTIEPIRVES